MSNKSNLDILRYIKTEITDLAYGSNLLYRIFDPRGSGLNAIHCCQQGSLSTLC